MKVIIWSFRKKLKILTASNTIRQPPHPNQTENRHTMLWILQAAFEFYKVTSPSLSGFQTLGCHRSSRVEMRRLFPLVVFSPSTRPPVGSRFTGAVWNSFPLWNTPEWSPEPPST